MTGEQAQFGAVIDKLFMQPFKVEVKVTFVPDEMPDTVLAILSTVPVMLLTVPELVNVTV